VRGCGGGPRGSSSAGTAEGRPGGAEPREDEAAGDTGPRDGAAQQRRTFGLRRERDAYLAILSPTTQNGLAVWALRWRTFLDTVQDLKHCWGLNLGLDRVIGDSLTSSSQFSPHTSHLTLFGFFFPGIACLPSLAQAHLPLCGILNSCLPSASSTCLPN